MNNPGAVLQKPVFTAYQVGKHENDEEEKGHYLPLPPSLQQGPAPVSTPSLTGAGAGVGVGAVWADEEEISQWLMAKSVFANDDAKRNKLAHSMMVDHDMDGPDALPNDPQQLATILKIPVGSATKMLARHHVTSCSQEDHAGIDCAQFMVRKMLQSRGVLDAPEVVCIEPQLEMYGFRLPCRRTVSVVLNPDNRLGRGAHAIVYHATSASGQYSCAVKVSAEEHNNVLQNEVDMLLLLNRFPCVAGVPRLLGHGMIRDNQYLVLDGVGQSLESILQQAGGPCSQPLSFVQEITSHLVPSLCQMHGRGVMHRHICPNNIVRLKSGEWRFVDFGSSCMVDDGDSEFATTNLFASFSVLNGADYTPYDDFASLHHTLSFCYEGVRRRTFTLMDPPAHTDVSDLLSAARASYRPWVTRQLFERVFLQFTGTQSQLKQC